MNAESVSEPVRVRRGATQRDRRGGGYRETPGPVLNSEHMRDPAVRAGQQLHTHSADMTASQSAGVRNAQVLAGGEAV